MSDETTWEPRPLPTVTPEDRRFWAAATEGTYLLSRCESCGLTYHYPRALCPDCFSDDVSWVESDGTGEVYTYSVTDSVRGWPDEHLPVVVAYVELEEGPRVLSNVVDCDPDDVEIGLPVEARFVPTGEDDVAIPVFAPRSGEG